MEFLSMAANGPILMTPKIWRDKRGYFMETFRQNEFQQHCGDYVFVQDNQSKSSGNVLRGLHYQLRKPQGKLVRVIHGKVFDVAVDLRKSQPTFGKSFYTILDNESCQSLWVPPGFAHGFLVMSAEAEFVYKCTTYYAPEDEHCLLWNDPAIHIPWPDTGSEMLLSPKDLEGLPLSACEVYE